MSARCTDLRTTAGRRLGVAIDLPQLGWAVEGATEVRGFRVQLASDEGFSRLLADTGEVAGWPSWVPWPGEPLRGRERVHWRVQVLADDGWTSWAADVVEAGLLHEQDWQAAPISWAEDPGGEGPGPSPRFATTFELQSEPVRGRLYVTALGLVAAQLNGDVVSEDVFAPGWSTYGQRLSYDTYDVTTLLRRGTNELTALLGDGWYRGSLTWGEGRHRCHYGDRVALLAQLEVELADGDRVVLATGQDGWTVTDSVVRSADIYDGCVTDLTHVPRPGTVERLDVDLRPRLFVRQGPPVRRTGVIVPVGRRGDVYDFGQNLAGWVRLRVRGTAGQTVRVRHAEVLDGDELLVVPLRTAQATDAWVLADGEQVLEPQFTFHGFRYAEVVTDAELLSLEAVVVHSDLERTAAFSCSDPRLERLHDNVLWGQRGNFLSVPTDCPQRDERLGWTGDAQVFAGTAGLLHDCRGFFADWLADLSADQHPDGKVPVVIPDVLSQQAAGIAGWSDAAVVVPWTAAQRSGDLSLLHRALPSMRAWVDWVDGQRIDGLWTGALQLGDWLDPAAPDGDPWQATTDRELVANAVASRSARLLGQSLEWCGQDGSRYLALSDEMARLAWARWGEVARSTQTGCALALRCGLVPDEERGAVAADLAELVRRSGGRIGTGFLGTPEVLYALSDTGHHEAAYALLLCEQCPSWLYQVARGATTMWERWDAVRPDGTVNLGRKGDDDAGMLSFNHYAYGAVGSWMHEVLAGLSVCELPEPALRIAPRPGGGLTWAAASLSTPRGRASVAWELDGDHLVVTADVPPGYAATFAPPAGGERPIGGGRHTWRTSWR